jgi:biotin carboxyl carrier protein
VTVEIGDASRDVEVSSDGVTFQITVGDTPVTVDALELAPGQWSLLLGSCRTSRDVRVRNNRRDSWTVFVDGQRVPVSVRPAGHHRAVERNRHEAVGPERVSTPMPGKVVRLLVAQGEAVTPGQGVAVVEAMKMENELRARRAGTVLDVLVREGTLVEAGAAVMVIG